MWRSDLSERIQRFINVFSSGVTKVIPISDEQVACVRNGSGVIILDTSSGDILSRISTMPNEVLSCNSKLQIISSNKKGVLQLSDVTGVLWKKKLPVVGSMEQSVVFSPSEQFLAFCDGDFFPFKVQILDAASGNSLHTFPGVTCKFLSDEECVVRHRRGHFDWYNIKSGHLLSVIDGGGVTCFAACPSQRLVAIALENSSSNFKVVQVRLPRDKESRRRER